MTLCYKKTTTNVIHIKQQQLNNSHTKVVVEYVYLFVYSMILMILWKHAQISLKPCHIEVLYITVTERNCRNHGLCVFPVDVL